MRRSHTRTRSTKRTVKRRSSSRSRRRPLSEYNKFVQKEMKKLKKGTPKNKMRKIAKMWRESQY